MTTTSPQFSAAIRTEQLTALATPAAKLLLAMSAVMAAVSMTANLSAIDNLASDATIELAMHASTVATLVFAILAGLYSATTDHRFGLIDQRLLGQPNRTMVVSAKAAVAAIVGLVYGVVGAVTSILVALAFYTVNGESFPVDSPLVQKALIGVMLAAPMFAMIGVAIGLVVANQPIAIGGTLAWLLIIEPVLLVGVPNVGKWFPGAAGIALTNNPDSQMGQLSACILLASYTLLALAVVNTRFRRTDV